MTQILDRLERAGLVGRSPDPDDRRKVVVGLTRKGVRTADARTRPTPRRASDC